MSRTRTTAPASPVRMTMSLNSSSLIKRPFVVRLTRNAGLSALGSAPIEPIADCLFCCWIARATSADVRPIAASRSGSSQMRIEYCSRPKIVTLPTPRSRFNAGATVMSARLVR